jgi:hypothetical protein
MNSKVKLTLQEILHGVYHVSAENRFDLAMTFLRSQEFYESDNPEVFEQNFDIIKYMRWYARKANTSSFEYPNDWAGFNVPSRTINSALAVTPMREWTIYDYAMKDIIDEIPYGKFDIVDHKPIKKFYLIGTMTEGDFSYHNASVLSHEIAHAFYYLDGDYKKSTDELIATMSNGVKLKIFRSFKRLGYAERVWPDELQAYMISGMESIANTEVDKAPFQEIFDATLERFTIQVGGLA